MLAKDQFSAHLQSLLSPTAPGSVKHLAPASQTGSNGLQQGFDFMKTIIDNMRVSFAKLAKFSFNETVGIYLELEDVQGLKIVSTL